MFPAPALPGTTANVPVRSVPLQNRADERPSAPWTRAPQSAAEATARISEARIVRRTSPERPDVTHVRKSGSPRRVEPGVDWLVRSALATPFARRPRAASRRPGPHSGGGECRCMAEAAGELADVDLLL